MERSGNVLAPEVRYLRDLRAWHLVRATCRCCRHSRWISHHLLARGQAHDVALVRIADRLRCTECRSRGGFVDVFEVPPP